MNKDFVTFNLAKKLKEKGFPQYTEKSYFVGDHKKRMCRVGALLHVPTQNTEHLIAAPTIAQVLKWLREEKIFISICLSMCGYHYDVQYNIKNNSDYPDLLKWDNAILNGEQTIFASYEEAAIAGIEYVIDNLI